jgi:hypothetical protein
MTVLINGLPEVMMDRRCIQSIPRSASEIHSDWIWRAASMGVVAMALLSAQMFAIHAEWD